MFSDEFLRKISSKKWPNIFDNTLDNKMNIETSVAAETDDFFDHLPGYKTKSSDLSEFHKRVRTKAATFKDRRDPCRITLIPGPFTKLVCGLKRNFTG